MQYDLSNDFQRKAFLAKMDNLLDKGAVVEVTEKTFRSPSQNRYLHLLLGVVAMETGNTIEDVKTWYFKRTINPDIFIFTKTDRMGNTLEVCRSTSEVSKDEMSLAIDRLKRWGHQNGIYLPDPTDLELLRSIEIELGRNKAYLGA